MKAQDSRMPWKVGDEVNIYNTGISGTIFFEGRAKVVQVLKAEAPRVMVHFPGDPENANVCRFVDPDGQGDDPEAHAAKMNGARAWG